MKTKVNNNIKLKSGGGLINDATDGLSVESPLVASSITTGANATAIGSALNTVYQNNTTRPRFVCVSVWLRNTNGGSQTAVAKIGNTNTPTIDVAQYLKNTMWDEGEGASIPLTFIVPAGYYYEILTTGGSQYGSPAVAGWFECDLI